MVLAATQAPGAVDATLGFLALGDSYTIGEGVAPELRWPEQLAAELRGIGLPVRAPHVIATTGWTTDELATALDAAEPLGTWDLVSLLVGVNDQYRGRDLPAFVTGFVPLLDRAIGYAGGDPSRVFVLSIPDWGVTPFARDSGRDVDAIARELDAYNGAIARACVAARVAFVDIAPAVRTRGDAPDMLADDGLHPSGTMYTEWTRLALPVARTLLERR